jgi:hypothetical protein
MTAPEAINQVVAAQQAWSEVILSNDADRIADHMADDWVIVTPGGVATSDQFLGAIRASALRHTRMEPAQGARRRPYRDMTPDLRTDSCSRSRFLTRSASRTRW